MSGIPSKCPNCGKRNAWKEEVNIFKSGISIGGITRIRIGIGRGLLARPIMKALGCYKVTYRCRNCDFREEYDTEDA